MQVRTCVGPELVLLWTDVPDGDGGSTQGDARRLSNERQGDAHETLLPDNKMPQTHARAGQREGR